ncbi:hypothetical protein [Coleofasciculus sp. LEGE 07092]|nr:hypothetical protein [Coleofasciculus sp. LEGE 07092]
MTFPISDRHSTLSRFVAVGKLARRYIGVTSGRGAIYLGDGTF